MKIGFYLLGDKGFKTLIYFLNYFGGNEIEFIVVSRDLKVENDFYYEIIEICQNYKLTVFEKDSLPIDIEKNTNYSFAVGWRWLIIRYKNLIVLHDSLLPKYRGFSPLVNMLVNEETKIGVTALFASGDYDKGDIIAQKSIDIEYPIKISEAINIILPLYGSLIVEISKNIFSENLLIRTPQIEKNATYSMWRDEYDYAIDWLNDSDYIERFVNSVSTPFAGAYSFIKNKKVRIIEVEKIADVYIKNRANHIGKCIFKKNTNPVIVCGSGLLLLKLGYWDEDKSSFINSFPFRTRLTSVTRDL